MDECVKVWAVQDEAPFVENSHTYTSHTLGVVSVTVDPTGTFAASSALDSFIRVWNLQVRPPKMLRPSLQVSHEIVCHSKCSGVLARKQPNMTLPFLSALAQDLCLMQGAPSAVLQQRVG